MPLSALASTDPNGPSSPDALRVQGSTRATVARALKGETAATPSPTWPSDWRRTVYNLVFRFTGNRKCAKSVTRLMDPVSKRIPKDGRPFIHIARDLLEGDRANDGGVTPAIFHGPQLITAEMPQELRGILGDQEEACINKNEIKGNLEPAILGVLELTFIDDRPMHEVAALLDLTPGLLLTFLISLFDHLGDIASLDDRA